MLRYIYLTALFIVVHTSMAFCATPPKAAKKPLTARYDSLAIDKRAFDSAALEKYHQLEEFKYGDGFVGTSLWERFKRWFWSLFDDTDPTILGIGIQYLLITAGVAAIVFLIIKLAGVDVSKIIRGKSASATLAYSEYTENIHEIDVDDELEKAIGARNYRFAVRLLYLKTLKQLNEAGLIHWEPNKTNNDYRNELQDLDQRLAFNLLTRQFEYIWYGEFNIDADVFNRISSLFTDFKVKR